MHEIAIIITSNEDDFILAGNDFMTMGNVTFYTLYMCWISLKIVGVWLGLESVCIQCLTAI